MAWIKTKTIIAIGASTVLAGAAVLTLEQKIREQEQAIRAEEQQIRAQEQQIRAQEQQLGLSADDKKLLDEKLAQLRARHDLLRGQQDVLRASQDKLREQDPNPFARPSAQISPFTKVRFDGDKVSVTYLATEYELAAIDDLPVASILDFCRRQYGAKDAQKRFAEDLVVVLSQMGHPAAADNTVNLALIEPAAGQTKTVEKAPMTKENRQAVAAALRASQQTTN